MSEGGLSYRDAGVDLDAAESAKNRLKDLVARTRDANTLSELGAFGGLYQVPDSKSPVLVSSADGVGTKLKVAFEAGRHDTVGQCLVNHCVNDILVQGARPMFFLDYLATGKMDETVVTEVVTGVAIACQENACALLGGETAQMPDTYRAGAYDVAGTMIGVAERSALPRPERVLVGDRIVGVAAVGPHTNGYSLARKTAAALGPDYPVGSGTLAEALLAPHPSYYAELQAAFSTPGVRVVAHITGGGLEENVPRVLPEGVGARFDVGTWAVPPVFDVIAADQAVERREMYRIFNMGIGLAIVVAADEADALLRAVPGSFQAGEVVERSDPRVVLAGL